MCYRGVYTGSYVALLRYFTPGPVQCFLFVAVAVIRAQCCTRQITDAGTVSFAVCVITVAFTLLLCCC